MHNWYIPNINEELQNEEQDIPCTRGQLVHIVREVKPDYEEHFYSGELDELLPDCATPENGPGMYSSKRFRQILKSYFGFAL
jgi:hypothetical protein